MLFLNKVQGTPRKKIDFLIALKWLSKLEPWIHLLYYGE